MSAPAFDQLLAANLARVHRAALGMLGEEQEAREVAQEALARAWSARGRYDSSRPFYPWLRAIVSNACRDSLRRRRPFQSLDPQPASGSPTPAALLDCAQARRRVRRGMQRLSEEHREILVLRHFEDLSYAEIAGLLGVPRGTVMSRLYRARRALLAALEDEP